MTLSPSPSFSARKLGKVLLFALLVGAAFWSTRDGRSERFIEWVAGAGWVGMLIFGVVYILATVLLIPGSLLTLAAGAIYGPLWGLLLISPASVLGATAAFLLARGALRPWVEGRLLQDKRFQAIDSGVAAGGFKIVMLLRLSPLLPFNLVNYALGLTRISTSGYVAASAIGMLPGTFLYVYSGSIVRDLTRLGEGGPEGPFRWVVLGVGLLATAAVTWLLARTARRALAEQAAGAAPRVDGVRA
jgi:uncharacterized membrane protein YdjX (TVP38/TMEM64 family)